MIDSTQDVEREGQHRAAQRRLRQDDLDEIVHAPAVAPIGDARMAEHADGAAAIAEQHGQRIG